MKAWALALATAMLGSAGVLLASRSSVDSPPQRPPLTEFPIELADRWKGSDLPMEAKALDVLRLTDYVLRNYSPLRAADARLDAELWSGVKTPGPVSFYMAYYESQRTGATYHSPLNCLPGSGWQIAQSGQVAIQLPGAGSASVNRLVIEKGEDRLLVLYWYQDRGRTIASEYAGKVALVWDAATRNRTDGALVRISTPVGEDREAAYERALRFVLDAWPYVIRHAPA